MRTKLTTLQVSEQQRSISSLEQTTQSAQSIVKAVELFYTKLGVNSNNIKTDYDVPAGHGMVTRNYGNNCGTSDLPYINDCGLDVVGRILEQIYGSLKQPGKASKEHLKAFDQTVFFAGDVSAQLDDRGHVYVPNDCSQAARCPRRMLTK
jgi:hypothetical protein